MGVLDFKKFIYPLFGVFEGIPGRNGVTPHIGENGNWFLGDYDTGKPSVNTEKLQELMDYIDSILVVEISEVHIHRDGGEFRFDIRCGGSWEIM